MVERLQEAPIKYAFFRTRPDLVLSDVWKAFFRDLRTIKSDRPSDFSEGNIGFYDALGNLIDAGVLNEIIDDRLGDFLQEGTAINLNYDDANNTLTISLAIKANNGIGSDVDGIFVKLKSGFGITVDADGLQLKQQNHIANASAVSAISLGAGADTVDRATFNTDLAAMVSEINDIKTIVNTILSNLEGAEINKTS